MGTTSTTLGVLYPALPVAIAIAVFGLLGRHALEMRAKHNYREMWGAVTLSLLPSAIFLLIVASGEPSMLTRNLLLVPAGALIGACVFVYAGYVAFDLRAAKAQPTGDQLNPVETIIVAQGGPTINTWNQSGGNNTINVGPIRLAFDPAIGEELASKIPTGKPITLQSIGSQSDQTVADQYQKFLQSRGFNIARRNTIGMMAPPPDHKISILDTGPTVVITIAPSAN